MGARENNGSEIADATKCILRVVCVLKSMLTFYTVLFFHLLIACYLFKQMWW